MKRVLLLLGLLALILPAFSQTVKIGDLYYYLSYDEAEVIPKSSNWGDNSDYVSGNVKIPATVSYQGTTYPVVAVGNYAFTNCDNLTGIEIPNTVTYIGYGAFSGCANLSRVDIPNSVTAIWSSAFNNCHSLKSVVIPNSVVTIEAEAFGNCFGLSSVIIGDSVTSIEDGAFNNCHSLTSVVIGKSVMSMGEDVFKDCNNIIKGAYPSSLSDPFPMGKTIKYLADNVVIENGIIYKKNKEDIYFVPLNLEGEFIIPNTVTSIGEAAFYGCEGLTSVTLPNGLTSIGNEAFYGCGGLTSIVIPKPVISIGRSAFYKCNRLSNLTFNAEDCVFCGNASNPVFPSSITMLLIGESVERIPDYAFYNCRNLTSVQIPLSVTSIGNEAFYGCNGLTSITLPNNVSTIGRNAFDGCKISNLSLGSNVKTIGDYAFSSCPLKDIKSFNSIPPAFSSHTFSDYTAKVLVPPTSFDAYKASDWSKFLNLTWEDMPIEINGIYYKCNSALNTASITTGYYGSLSNITIPDKIAYNGKSFTVTAIEDGAFKNCANIREVILPPTIKNIGTNVFTGCVGLVKAAYPNSITNPFTNGISISYSPTTDVLEDGVIYNNQKTNLIYVSIGKTGSFVMPNSVNIIGKDALSNCSGLSSVTLSNTLSKIERSAFFECKGLKKLQFNNNILRWCQIVFDNEYSNPLYYAHTLVLNGEEISDLSLPSTISKIGDYTFINGQGIKNIIIPNTITKIGARVFDGCNKIETITSYCETPPSIESNTFTNYNATLYVLEGKEKTYKGTANWKNFQHVESIPTVYLGIIGFNRTLKERNIGLLDEFNVNNFTNWVNDLQLAGNTLLYYTCDEAINRLKNYHFPSKLSTAAIITFTDGLDQGSLAYNSNMTTDQQYLDYLSNKIATTKIQDVDLKAYTLGVEGVDVADQDLFRRNLEALASSPENVNLINNFSQLGQKFDAIYNDLAQTKSQTILTISIPLPSDNSIIRFTLDGANSAESSKVWIQGTFNRASNQLINVEYHGLTSSSGKAVRGVQKDLNIAFTFEDCRNLNGSVLVINTKNDVDQWTYISSSGKWQHNIEMGDGDIELETRNSTAIMLLIDCSSSIGNSDFEKVKAAANTFIERLVDYKYNGVEEIIIDEDSEELMIDWSEAEYYNLQGIRVMYPSNGIYIRRVGNHSQKVFVP